MTDEPVPADTPGRILRAARDLFEAKGYQRTSLREIADRLGLTKAAILYHFPSKEHLIVALAEPFLLDLEAMLDRAAELPWPAARWAALEGWLDVMLAHRHTLSGLHHDLALVSRGGRLTRLMRIATRMYGLVAGPNADRRERVRAVQATAALGDPVIFFLDTPPEVLRADMLDGVRRLLADPPGLDPGRDAAPEPVPAAAPEPEPRPAPPTPATATTSTTASTATAAEAETMTAPHAASGVVAEPTGRRAATGAHAGGHPAPGGPRSRRAGRPRALSPEQVRLARALHADGSRTVDAIAASLGVSRATLYRHLRSTGSGSETD